MRRSLWRAVIGVSLAFVASVLMAPCRADEDPSDKLCGPYGDPPPELRPIIRSRIAEPANDHAFGCLAWQSFIYLNWPAQSPGEPDGNAPFGRPGPTLWETYKRHSDVFLPNAAPPAPWGDPDFSHGAPRYLTVSHQAGGEMLIDRAGKPVYYEMLINRDEFNYIVENKLFDAATQYAFAQVSDIVLPAGPTAKYGPIGTIELKAAWKVLTAKELAQRPRRFHTAEAVLDDGSKVIVGLVGFHLNQRITGFTQGVWATFAQVDSAPLVGEDAGGRDYSFYDPACAHCAANVATRSPQGTQVVQVFPVAPSVRGINAYVLALIRGADPDSPWQFYELLGVQWPQFALGFPTPVPEPRRHLSRSVPLSIGTPSTQTLMNPVIETFHQNNNVSCLGCHAAGATAMAADGRPFPADYSFLFAHAQRSR